MVERGATPPWQALALHDPGPRYLLGGALAAAALVLIEVRGTQTRTTAKASRESRNQRAADL